MTNEKSEFLAGPCGLYCGICADNITTKECHGCGCDCGQCAGGWHGEHCEISLCARKHKVSHCGECQEFACTKLIQFTSDPVWTTHAVCIENLRRRNKIGTEGWLGEQEAYWANEDNRKKEIMHHDLCGKRWQEMKKEK